MTPCVASSTPQPHHHHLSHTIAIYPSTPFPLANKRLHPSLNTSLYLHPSLKTSLYIYRCIPQQQLQDLYWGSGSGFSTHARTHTHTLHTSCSLSHYGVDQCLPFTPKTTVYSISTMPRKYRFDFKGHKSKTTQKPLPVYCRRMNTLILPVSQSEKPAPCPFNWISQPLMNGNWQVRRNYVFDTILQNAQAGQRCTGWLK